MPRLRPIGLALIALTIIASACGSTSQGAAVPGGTDEPSATSTRDSEPTATEDSGQWALATMGDPADPSSVSTERVTTITFAEGELTGATPCNRYHAPYTLEGSKLTIGTIGATRALCGDPILDSQEVAYLQALDSATELTTDGDTLTITYGRGQQLRYQKA